MFEVLFKRPHAIARHRDGPLADSRRRYLAKWAALGMTASTLRVLADYLLIITHRLHLDGRGEEPISPSEVEVAAARWANRRPRPAKMSSTRYVLRRFRRIAKRWLQFLGRLQLASPVLHSYADRLAAFADFQKEKGLSPQTIHCRGRVVQRFLDRLCSTGRRLKEVSPLHLDAALAQTPATVA